MGIAKSKRKQLKASFTKTTMTAPTTYEKRELSESRSSELISESSVKTASTDMGGGDVDLVDDSWGLVEFSDTEESVSVEFSENEYDRDRSDPHEKSTTIYQPPQIYSAEVYAHNFMKRRFTAAIKRRERQEALKREKEKEKIIEINLALEHPWIGLRVCVGGNLLGYGRYGEILAVDYDTRAFILLDCGKRIYSDIMDLKLVRVYE